ncbi:MAG: GGDEF domain-containing protein [Pseudomonadota bacterium]
MNAPKHAAATDSHSLDDFTWLSNPLDWRPIDRLILLGALTLLAPGMFAAVLLASLAFAPAYLVPGVARAMLAFFLGHGLLLLGFLVAALSRRRAQHDFPAYENFIIASFVVAVILSTWVAGTHFTMGLLLLFMGINITSALADVRKIRIAYIAVCVIMVLLAVLDFTGMAPFAPIFAQAPYRADGSPTMGWLGVQVQLAFILLAISSISMAAVHRWVERENLYREMSTIDGLTRLANRRSFIERGHSELSRAQRVGTSPVACVMVDLDHFKRVNDSYGHHAGDQVLVVASAIMMESARQYDEVGRYGGEEFAILLPGASLEAAEVVAERIRARIAATPVEVDGKTITMTASFGVSCYPAPGIGDLNDLLKAADKALYVAKESGRNRVCLAMPEPEPEVEAPSAAAAPGGAPA